VKSSLGDAANGGEERRLRPRGGVKKRVGLVVGVVSLLAPSAWGQAPPAARPAGTVAGATVRVPASAHARKLLASAAKKRAGADYEGALADYRAADTPVSSPEAVEGMAFCNDKLGHLDEALAGYKAFLAGASPALGTLADDARARVAAINAMPGHLHLETNPASASVSVDGAPQPGATPLDIDLPAGKHQLHVTAPDHDAVDKEVEVVARGKHDVALSLSATPPPPPPTPPTPPPPSPLPAARAEAPTPHSVVPACITGVVALVAAGVGVGFGVATLNDKSNFNSHPTLATADAGDNHALVADMSFGLAIGLGATSIYLFTRHEESGAAAAPAGGAPATPAASAPRTGSSAPITFTAAPFVAPHAGGAGALLRF